MTMPTDPTQYPQQGFPPQPGVPAPAPAYPQAPMPGQIPTPAVPVGSPAPGAPVTVNWQELIQEAATGAANPVPPGTYDVVIIEASHTQTSNGKLMFKVKFRVLAGPQAGPPSPRGRRARTRRSRSGRLAHSTVCIRHE